MFTPKVKSFLKSIIPPIFFTKQKVKKDVEWSGDFNSWDEAKSVTIGYDDQIILNACRKSLLAVKNCEYPYERDSVLFDKIQYSFGLLYGLQYIALENGGCLNLIDFGGSLGSSYFQNRLALDNLKTLRWNVVEQSHFVDCGRKDFQDTQLRFFYTIDECLQSENAKTLLLSGVLQCLEKPYEWLASFLLHGFDYIIIDRTAFIEGDERITRQDISEAIGRTSYPSWFFNESTFLTLFQKHYHLLTDFDSFADPTLYSEDRKKLYWKGFIFKKHTECSTSLPY